MWNLAGLVPQYQPVRQAAQTQGLLYQMPFEMPNFLTTWDSSVRSRHSRHCELVSHLLSTQIAMQNALSSVGYVLPVELQVRSLLSSDSSVWT